MHPALQQQRHRPSPLPRGPWVWSQCWEHLLFAHWRVSAGSLRRHVPAELEIETFDGSAWITLVPFLLGVRLRGTPALPGISRFAELNVRTYVTHRGERGVWFLRIDAGNRPAAFLARRLFRLPYARAQVELCAHGDGVSFRAKRAELVHFEADYRPCSEPFTASPGSLEHFLVERYRLYAGSLYSADIQHAPWPLQRAHAELRYNTVFDAAAIVPLVDRPLLYYARRMDTVFWPLRAAKPRSTTAPAVRAAYPRNCRAARRASPPRAPLWERSR